MRARGAELALGLLLVSGVFEFCASDNDTWPVTRDTRARIIKKLRKDYRKLKKQEGALKLIGGEIGDHEGAAIIFPTIQIYRSLARSDVCANISDTRTRASA